MKTGLPALTPAAFELRKNEEYLSASWLEHSGGTRAACLQSTVEVLRVCTNIAKNERCAFTIGQVEAIKQTCHEYDRKQVRILHEWKKDNAAYAAVRQIGPNNLELMERLASEAWAEIVLNASIPDHRP